MYLHVYLAAIYFSLIYYTGCYYNIVCILLGMSRDKKYKS